MRLDSSGNLALGLAPSAVSATYYKSFELGKAGSGLSAATVSLTSNEQVWLSNNSYPTYSSGTVWKYGNDGEAARYALESGVHSWYTAPSGTAGNAISFTQAMTLDASGNLLVGGTSVYAATITSYATATRSGGLGIRNSAGTAAGAITTYAAGSGSGSTDIVVESAGFLAFNAGGTTERARITSGGDLLVGTTTDSGYHRLNKSNTSDWVVAFTNASATTPWGVVLNYSAAAPNNTSSAISFSDTGGERATIRNNGGLANYSANDVNLSDRREKTNFAPAKSYLDTICAIPVQTFNYIDQSEDDPGLTLGVVAQDVQAVAPELVMESNWGTADEPKQRLSIYQTDLQYALMKALQELKAEFDAYKATHP
jgi:hypothetical protein